MKRAFKIIGMIFSIVLLIPIFLLEFLLIANITLNNLVSSDNLTDTLKEIMTYSGGRNENLLTYDSPGAGKLDYSLVKDKISEYLKNNGFSEYEANSIVNDSEFKEVVNNYLESVILNKIKDSDIKYPSKEEVKRFVENHYSALKKVKAINEKYTEEDINEFVDENYEDVKNKLREASEEVNIESKEFEYFKDFININPYMIFLIIIGIIILIMIFRMSFYKGLILVSIPTMLNGIIYSILGLAGMKLITSFANLENYLELLDPVIKKISTLMIQYGIISIIITIVMITIYVVIRHKKALKK